MTRRPLESHDVRGLSGPEYDLNILCAAPGCMERTVDTHHIWRRSFLAGDFNWVSLPDGSQVGNLVRLCRIHHQLVTDNAAWITWENESFCWSDDISVTQPLAFQPPHTLGEVGNTFDGITFDPLSDGTIGVFIDGAHEGHLENECPTCHQPLQKPKIERDPEEKRPRRTWSITVPVDERENGAATLDALLEAARVEMAKAGLAYGDEASLRFFILSGALGLFVQNFSAIVSE